LSIDDRTIDESEEPNGLGEDTEPLRDSLRDGDDPALTDEDDASGGRPAAAGPPNSPLAESGSEKNGNGQSEKERIPQLAAILLLLLILFCAPIFYYVGFFIYRSINHSTIIFENTLPSVEFL
jgi:hypothetical protein